MSRFPATLTTVLGLVLNGAAAADDELATGPPARDTLLEERVAVDRVTLPVSVEGAGCGRLRPADVVVEEDGRPVPQVTAIDRIRPLMLHALVIDASASMNEFDSIGVARNAAKAYIDGLHPGEKVLVASFDNNTRIRVPVTTLRTPLQLRRAHSAVDAIEAEGWTSLRDTLLSLGAYLDGRHERTAVVVLSDGVDSASAIPEERLRRFVEELSHRSALSVFVVGLRIPVASRTWKSLKSLAHSSGGRAFSLDDEGGLAETFVEIRELLHGEVTLEYESWPAGEGPRDRDANGPLVRRIRVELPRELHCRVIHHRERRVVRAAADGTGDELAAELSWPPAVEAPPGRTVPLPELAAWPELVAGLAPDDDDPASMSAVGADTLSGTIHDLQIDAGPLYVISSDHTLAHRNGRPVFVQRAFDVKLPEFSRLLEWIRGPEDVVFELMRLGIPFDAPDDASPETNVVVSGKALPWLRERIADLMFRHYPEYARWAAAKIELEKRHAVEHFVASELDRLSRLDGAAVSALDERREALVLTMMRGLTEEEALNVARQAERLESAAPHDAPQDGSGSASFEALRYGAAQLAERLETGVSDDEARYLAALTLNADRAAALCTVECGDGMEERLRQIAEVRYWLLRRELSRVGPAESGRYLAEWFADVTPRELAYRLERKIANRHLLFRAAGTERDRDRLARGWESLWRRFGGPEGVRSFAILHPAYRPDLDRVGFYRVTLPVPENPGFIRHAQVGMRGMFPRTPWALRLVETLTEHGLLDAIGPPVYVRRSVHRVVPARRVGAELVLPLDDGIALLADDWEIQRLAAWARGANKKRAEEELEDRRRRTRLTRRYKKSLEREFDERFEGDLVVARLELPPLPGTALSAPLLVTGYFQQTDEEPGVLGPVEPLCVEAFRAGRDEQLHRLRDAVERSGLEWCGIRERLRIEPAKGGAPG